MSALCYPLEEIFPDIQFFVPNASYPVCRRFALEACRRFCINTGAWLTSDDFYVTPDDKGVCLGICTLEDTAIERIDRARLNRTELEPKSRYWLDKHLYEWEEGVGGTPVYITQLAENTVRIVPSEPGHLFLRIVAKPSLDAKTIPAMLVENYRDIVAKDAAGMLLMSPEADIANPNLGQALLQEAQQKEADLRWRIHQTQAGAPLRVQPQWF